MPLEATEAPGAPEESNVTKLQGPVRSIEGKLILCIPLAAGGDKFVECTRGISEVRDGVLYVVVDKFAATLGIGEGDVVLIHNTDGNFNIRSTKPGSVQPAPLVEQT
jgi:hypothetical protein